MTRRVILSALSLALLVGSGLVLTWVFRTAELEPPPRTASLPLDPRLEYSGPFQNVHPEVSYVGGERCAPCHRKIASSYNKHPMARTLQAIADLAPTQLYDTSHNNPFSKDLGKFSVERRGDQVWHILSQLDQKGEPIFRQELEIQFAIGSGTHGHSYLTNRGGFLFQTPISWFAPRKTGLEKVAGSKLGNGMWDLSPGFTKAMLRPIPSKCFFCHANHSNPVEGTL